MTRTHRGLITLTIVSVLGAAAFATARASQWVLNGAPVCLAQNNQQYPEVVSDGEGGVIAVWMDTRSGQDYDLWAQRIDAWGRPVWQADGVPVALVVMDQMYPSVTSDGAGGAVIVWEDLRTGIDRDVYAQRLGPNGNPLWTVNGVAVCSAGFNQVAPRAASDGAGGAIITWEDARLNPNWDIYAQRITAAGFAQWAPNGVAVCSAIENQFKPQIVSDGGTGAIIVWEDFRFAFQYDIYAQRITEDGIPAWNANGNVICANALNQNGPRIAGDGAGGAVVTWADFRGGVSDSFAQRVGFFGGVHWTADGVNLTTTFGGEYQQRIDNDGANGAIVAWYDTRSGNGDIYAQRLSDSGSPLWGASGAPLCTAANYQDEPGVVGDGLGGAVVSWSDQRFSATRDVYARRISATGVPQGTANGVALGVLPSAQMDQRVASDGVGGAIVTWWDNRMGTQHVSCAAPRALRQLGLCLRRHCQRKRRPRRPGRRSQPLVGREPFRPVAVPDDRSLHGVARARPGAGGGVPASPARRCCTSAIRSIRT